MTRTDTMYVVIEGEPFLSRAKAYRAERFRVQEVVWEFAKPFGAEAVCGSLTGMTFRKGKQPDGWTKPNSRGYSKPKKGHPDVERLAALPRLPKSSEVFGDAICDMLRFTYEGGSGSSCIGPFFGPSIGWAGDVFVSTIPDPRAAVAALRSEHPEAVITGGADTWSLPNGLREISKAEHDLIFAQAAVDEERAAKSTGAALTPQDGGGA